MSGSNKRLYLDLCTLKRPWDGQSNPLVRAESEAVLMLIGLWRSGRFSCLHSPIHDHENDLNRNVARAASVRGLLESFGPVETAPPSVLTRARWIARLGISAADALNIALAEDMNADIFVTVDQRLRRGMGRPALRTAIPIMGPIEALAEFQP